MSKDGKDAELMKLTEEDCSLIRDALITMLEQLYRAKSEMPIVTEEFRALFEKQETEILVVKNKVWDIQSRLMDQRMSEEWELVTDYCVNDVLATEEAVNHLKGV